MVPQEKQMTPSAAAEFGTKQDAKGLSQMFRSRACKASARAFLEWFHLAKDITRINVTVTVEMCSVLT